VTELTWRTDDCFGHARYTAGTEFHSVLNGYSIVPSEKHGGFNIYGLLKKPNGLDGTSWRKTLNDAKAVALDDYRRRRRLEEWQEYMETHDAPDP
jgi:hypothetical protein